MNNIHTYIELKRKITTTTTTKTKSKIERKKHYCIVIVNHIYEQSTSSQALHTKWRRRQFYSSSLNAKK